MQARQLRNALGRFTTGVTIITCVDQSQGERGEQGGQGERGGQGAWVGLTANSFSALSLSPPLVLWSLRNESPMLAAFKACSHFAVNVLAEAQVELSRRFAARAGEARFAEGPWALGGQGAPVLAGCTAVFECRSVSHQLAGDHHLFIGEVLACEEAALPPLVFQAGHYRLLGEVL